MEKLKVGIVNLGCDKNRIDSEIVIGALRENYEITNNPKAADIILVNTCGFIETAKQESINSILEMGEYKTKHQCKVLIATGCLAQRYKEELLENLPELDIVLGVNDYDKLHQSIETVLQEQQRVCHCNYSDTNINKGKRVITTGEHTAYLRIAEGCDNQCAYCAIPSIRGRYRSRTTEEILEEAKELASCGHKEIILVAQDTTRYGVDIYGEKRLHKLIRDVSTVEGIEWIRVLYCYAEELTEEIIEEIATNKKVCKYLDIPIQHISDAILKNMRRRGRKKQILENIYKLRNKVQGICLRTSIIVGFPGETEEDFEELKQFIQEIKFDKLGVFQYSREEGTAAAEMENQIAEEVKETREKELMLLQQAVSKELNEKRIGKTYEVIVEGKEEEYYYGRSYEMSPEIDGAIFFKYDKMISKGQFIHVKITKALEYDLIGVVCDESCK